MTNKKLFTAWAVLYVICAGIGFIPHPRGLAYGSMILFSLIFFIPPGILLYRASVREDRKTLRLVRNLCLLSLSATLIALVLNFLSVRFSPVAGQVIYYVLILVSAPMVSGQIWLMSLFLWGCLLTASFQQLMKK